MKANGRADSTIERANQVLTQLSKICRLIDSEETKLTLARLDWENSTKRLTANILEGFYTFIKTPYDKPRYISKNKLPFIPTEQELDLLISATGRYKTTARLQLLKETGARSGELNFLKWIHIDFKRRTINITAEKGSNSRILPISDKLITMLDRLKRKSEYVFPTRSEPFRRTFEDLRKRTATKLDNPRLMQISLKTFRHFKGTMEYHKTRSLMHVKKILGHKSIMSTVCYINIESAIFQYVEDEWISKVATTIEEDKELIEAGFEYITERDGLKIYRKRK